IQLGSFDHGIGHLTLNLALSFAVIALAAMVAAPAQRGVSLKTKLIAVPGVVSGALGVLSSAMWLYTRMGQPQVSLPMDGGAALAVELFATERAVQNVFFSACTLALAILVLASRRTSA